MSGVPADVSLLSKGGRRTMLSFSSDNTYYIDNTPF